MAQLGIYEDDSGGVFYDAPIDTSLCLLVELTLDLAQSKATLIDPPDNTLARRIGEVVIRPVTDDAPYRVVPAEKEEPVAKPAVRRKPPGRPGTWTIQSVIFAKDAFTPAQARQWIKDHSDQYGDYGLEETANQLRFRQYDPQWFNQTRIITLTTGVTATYSRIAAERQKDATTTERMFVDAWARYDAMRAINDMIAKTGLLVVDRSTRMITKDDGQEEEERYVLSMVLEPNDGQDGAPLRPDTQKDIYSAADIRKGAHNWLESGGEIDLMHNWKAFTRDDVRPCESYLAPVDFTCGEGDRARAVLKGTWMLGLRILNDELWAAVKYGDLGAFSIGGTAERTPVPDAAGGDHG